MRVLKALGCIVATVFAGSAASATTFVENFDANYTGSGNYTIIYAPSTVGVFTPGALGIEIQNTIAGLSPPDSPPNLVELDTTGNSSMFTLISAGVYNLTFAYSARPGVAAASNGINVFLGATLLGSYAESGIGLGATAFSNKTINFTTFTGGALTFAATGLSDGLGGYLDTVALTQTGAVPEPATWAMAVMGFGLLGASMRRRRPQTSFA